MSFHDPDDKISAFGTELAGGIKHGVGLAHARGCPEEDLQLATVLFGFFGADLDQQLIGIGASLSILPKDRDVRTKSIPSIDIVLVLHPFRPDIIARVSRWLAPSESEPATTAL